MGSHTNVKSHYNAVHVHLQASFCHSSFGVKIKLERSGDPIHIKGKTITASEEGIKALADTTLKTIGTADHVIYLVHDKRTCESNPICTCGGLSNCGYVAGIAPISMVCIPRQVNTGIKNSKGEVFHAKVGAFMMSINEWTENKNTFGTVSSKNKNTVYYLFYFTAHPPMPKFVYCYSYSLLHMRLDTISESHMILIRNMVEMVNLIVEVLVKRM